ncbi:hypothetical protein K9N68_04530 [Kovacikia minuta CCNUW1]|uniref:DUF6745 domain-containing protein n=1 Tax=Kovacikia minuta TaxID=2931930 RepID=UPI001CCEDB5E|nr:hypothetical protein [Kovacikia minuta]UBF27236.1 hypothetical protein K9N68_04530 [Kovacikia minuta CCNUW1]
MSSNPAVLTPEQEQLIPVYREKWKQLARSTQRVNRQKASEAIQALYQFMDRQPPDVYFFDSPYSALKAIKYELLERVKDELIGSTQVILEDFIDKLMYPPLSSPFVPATDFYFHYLREALRQRLYDETTSQVSIVEVATSQIQEVYFEDFRLDSSYYESFRIEDWVPYGCLHEFCLSVMGENNCTRQEWEIFQAVSSNLYRAYLYQNICVVSDRPTKLSIDKHDRVHANNEPAIEFADGFGIYASRGHYIRHRMLEA